MRRLLGVVPDTIQGRRDRAILLVFILTGRRRTEVMDLKASDISIEDGTVFYTLPRQGRQARTTGAAATGLGGHPADARGLRQGAGDDGPGRVALAGRGRSEGALGRTFYARFRRYLVAAGLQPTGLHILRHSAAKLRRDAGESVETVSAFLDHSSLAVTTTYLRRLEGVEDHSWERVAEAIGV